MCECGRCTHQPVHSRTRTKQAHQSGNAGKNELTPQQRSLRGKSWILHFPKQFQMASQARKRHNSCKMICIPASLTIPLFLLYTLWIPALLVCLPRIAGIRNGIIRLYTSSSFIRCLHCFEGFFCQTIESLQRKQEEKKQNIGRRRRKCQ